MIVVLRSSLLQLGTPNVTTSQAENVYGKTPGPVDMCAETDPG